MRELTREQFSIIREWNDTPIDQREFRTQGELATYMNLTQPEISSAVKQAGTLIPRDMEERRRRLRDKYYKDAMRDGASAKEKELAGRAHGVLIDRVEQIIKIVSADEIARSELEAERRVREVRAELEGRVEGVSEKLPLLPEEIREDK